MVEMGLIVTEDQYAEGYFTNLEAQSIATCFTPTGVVFWLVYEETTGISGYFVPFSLTFFTGGILQGGFHCISIRIPLLSELPDEYYVKNENNVEPSNVEYSPVLDIWGYPFRALLTLLNVHDAAIVSVFFDMFLPMILVTEAASIQMFHSNSRRFDTNFFPSEVIAYLINSRIPIKFSHMVLIFLQRTVIAILYLVSFTYLFGIVG